MGKGLTPLEALNELRNNYVPVFNSRRMGKQQVVKSFAIIEKALKNYEILKDYHTAVISNREFDKEYFEKSIKTLGVIKNKKVNVHLLLDECCPDLETYNCYGFEPLTQEEYDLLREILL